MQSKTEPVSAMAADELPTIPTVEPQSESTQPPIPQLTKKEKKLEKREAFLQSLYPSTESIWPG